MTRATLAPVPRLRESALHGPNGAARRGSSVWGRLWARVRSSALRERGAELSRLEFEDPGLLLINRPAVGRVAERRGESHEPVTQAEAR